MPRLLHDALLQVPLLDAAIIAAAQQLQDTRGTQDKGCQSQCCPSLLGCCCKPCRAVALACDRTQVSCDVGLGVPACQVIACCCNEQPLCPPLRCCCCVPPHQSAAAAWVLGNCCDLSSMATKGGYVFTRFGAVHPNIIPTGCHNQSAVCGVAQGPPGDDAAIKRHVCFSFNLF